MRYRDRVTACLSSQVGCALGCVFCATGQLGFTRDLTVGEIVAQAVFVARQIRESNERLRNVVLMGMGEPLLNYDAVMTALEILHDSGGLAIGAKQITLSTVGVIPGIVRLADERRPYSLAVSLHAATQAERLALIPAARPWPLDELMDACRYYTERLQRKIFFEWTLIADENDSVEHARSLGELLRGIPAQVNLIPLNPTAGFVGEPALNDSVQRFRSILAEYHIPVTVRQRRGLDIAGGCGQLAGAEKSLSV
jgi:23S rRNA (adenine2503-C2)-methyltransferase